MYQFNRKEYEERMKWYQDARFGMFIHWGLYSIPARGEWVRSTEEMAPDWHREPVHYRFCTLPEPYGYTDHDTFPAILLKQI